MEPLKFYKKHKLLSLFFLVAVLTIIAVNYFLSDIPQCWKYGYITGQIFTNLAVGYILSLIFFFLVVYIKDKKDQENISPRISKAIVLILDKGDSLESMLFKGQRKTTRDPEVIRKVCNETKFYEINYSSNIRKKHWVDYLNNIADDCKYYMGKMFKLNGVDTDLIKILTELDDSVMLGRPKLVVGLPGKDERTIEPLSNQIIQFFEIMAALESYWIKNYSHFTEHEQIRRFKK